jgi:hypothetical protein
MADYPATPSGALDAGGAFVIGGGDFAYGQDYNEQIVRSLYRPPVPTPTNAISLLRKQLSNMPLEALQYFKDLIPDWAEGAFDTVGGAVDAIVSALTGVVNFLTHNAFTEWVNDSFQGLFRIVNQVMDILSGIIVTPINQGVAAVKDFINGIGTTITNGAQIVQKTLDGLWGGFLGLFGIGKSPADVANAGKNLAGQANTAVQIGEWNNAVLGIRNNKSLFSGIDETEESNFTIEALFTETAEPAGIINATATSIPVAYWRGSEDAKKGFISWMGKGFANITALYIDLYKADPVTKKWKLFHQSTNQIGQVTAAWKYLQYFIPPEARFQVVAGDVIGVAWRVVGTGTHSIAGRKSGSWMPAHPTVHPALPASTRTGVGDLNYADTTYTGDIPWFGIGIAEGDIPPDYYAPRTTTLLTPGAWTYDIPVWANKIDVVKVGAGAGGCGGNGGTGEAGLGGYAGQWHAETLVRGVDFPTTATQLTGIIGEGGVQGQKEQRGKAGTPTTRDAIAGGKAAASAPGGSVRPEGYPYGNIKGFGCGDLTFNGENYIGSDDVGYDGSGANGATGQSPGGGGGGGRGGVYGVAFQGGKGGNGGTFITARQ